MAPIGPPCAQRPRGVYRLVQANVDGSSEPRECLESRAGSDGRRNTCLQCTCRSLEAQGLSGTSIQAQRDLVELRL
jgi:hypothetical protein